MIFWSARCLRCWAFWRKMENARRWCLCNVWATQSGFYSKNKKCLCILLCSLSLCACPPVHFHGSHCLLCLHLSHRPPASGVALCADRVMEARVLVSLFIVVVNIRSCITSSNAGMVSTEKQCLFFWDAFNTAESSVVGGICHFSLIECYRRTEFFYMLLNVKAR